MTGVFPDYPAPVIRNAEASWIRQSVLEVPAMAPR